MHSRVRAAGVARLATVRADGTPHLVPVCFALESGDTTAVSIVDGKPKRRMSLQRLDNVRAQPRISILVDHYDDDWTQLWWVRVDGTAEVIERGPAYARAVELLTTKYSQYREQTPTGAVLRIALERWTGWSAAG
jgi:PPOX class probable F420-dependent enzyme